MWATSGLRVSMIVLILDSPLASFNTEQGKEREVETTFCSRVMLAPKRNFTTVTTIRNRQAVKARKVLSLDEQASCESNITEKP
jgi:hypothetical protein